MTPQSALEISGNFLTHPFAELAAEIREAKLDGSLRCAYGETKCIFYYKKGRLRFAVSNQRATRLFDILLRRGRLTQADLAKIPNFQNDFELTAFLEDTNFLSKEDVSKLFVEQIESIMIQTLAWPDGKWTFTPLARLRDGVEFDIKVRKVLVDFARILPVPTVLRRFRSLNEEFQLGDKLGREIDLQKPEVMLLARFNADAQTATDAIASSGLDESDAIKVLYTLWLGGYLVRKEWNPAFSDMSIANMLGARLELKQEAKVAVIAAPTEKPKTVDVVEPEPAKPVEVISVDEYLERAEGAVTFYDLLGVDSKADIGEIKRAYFFLAKQFHPDHFHKSGDEILKRVQAAFTQLAQAHETLRSESGRETYDFKVRKELADREKRENARSGGTYEELTVQMQQAAESFDHGFNLLMDGNASAAETFLARAAHFAPKNAKYHAYYGKALSANEKHRHKAEAELQAAIKLDGNNPTFRLMLAEFFIQMNLMKRAEGELNRLLAIFPSNREARDMLAEITR
ncbi:MAG TPA: DnaJ domain-containing protein [Pyrinomonadaceae bacterium]|nr:DnaJ domain-containing protein [Pyrinomonadaceae bacterium]